MSNDAPPRQNLPHRPPCMDHESRVRDLERWRDRCDGGRPAFEARLGGIEREVRELKELMERRDQVYTERFHKITKTIAWAAGALSVMVFVAQVLLPMLRQAAQGPPIVIQAPAQPGTQPTVNEPGDN